MATTLINFKDPSSMAVLQGLPEGASIRYGADGTYGDIMHVHVLEDGTRTFGVGRRVERIRRVTGYLTGSLTRFNDAKKAEVADRKVHMHLAITKNEGATVTVDRNVDPLARFRNAEAA